MGRRSHRGHRRGRPRVLHRRARPRRRFARGRARAPAQHRIGLTGFRAAPAPPAGWEGILRAARARNFGPLQFLDTAQGRGWSYIGRAASWSKAPAGASRADLAAALGTTKSAPALAGPPFRGGKIGILSYDLGRLFERLGSGPPDDLKFPLWLIAEVPAVIASDGQAWFIAWREGGEKEAEALAEILAAAPPAPPEATSHEGPAESFPTPEEYEEMVRAAQEYIAAGDIYQVNLARRFRLPAPDDPLEYYLALRRRNPAPYAAYLETPWGAVASSSPECLFEAEALHTDGSPRRIRTRPIAGTYPRSREAATLPRDPKERAEHVMLLDLERNDLGRIAEIGTVRVAERLAIETYATVHHLVSEVTAVLRPDTTNEEILRAVFPGGTITGCPKVRAMQIIDELEPTVRGPYTGSIFCLGDDGYFAANIVIRTALIRGGEMFIHAGAGIVSDSEPEREAAETEAKAAGLLRDGRASSSLMGS